VGTQAPRSHEVEVIRHGLEVVLQGGARPAWLIHCQELLELRHVRGEAGSSSDDPYVCALIIERLLVAATTAMGDGPVGRACRLLLGVNPGSRGRPLKDRRRLAAAELDILPSTFRKNYEDAILDDLAFEVWRIGVQ